MATEKIQLREVAALTGALPGQYVIMRGSSEYLPGAWDDYESAYAEIVEYEERTGQTPGCDHGFGVGSGFRPVLIDLG